MLESPVGAQQGHVQQVRDVRNGSGGQLFFQKGDLRGQTTDFSVQVLNLTLILGFGFRPRVAILENCW